MRVTKKGCGGKDKAAHIQLGVEAHQCHGDRGTKIMPTQVKAVYLEIVQQGADGFGLCFDIKGIGGCVGCAKTHQVRQDYAETAGNLDADLLPTLRRTRNTMQQEQRLTVTPHEKTQPRAPSAVQPFV